MRSFVHLVADYGPGDPAFSEVVHRLVAAEPRLTVQPTPVAALSTVATGFWIEQLAVHNPPFDRLLVYSNTAPRTDAAGEGRADSGGGLRYAELDNGVPVVAVDAGYNLAFVRPHVETLRDVPVPDDDTQFRSRDHFPERVAAIARGELAVLGEERAVGALPDPPVAAVCHVDGYGNVKTSIRASRLDADADAGTGERIRVTIGGTSRRAHLADAVAAIPSGGLGLVPGSAGGTDPYLELIRRGGSAAEDFGRPTPGAAVDIDLDVDG